MKELEELNSVDRKGCEELEGIEVIFDIRKILELKYWKIDLKLFIGIHSCINFILSWFANFVCDDREANGSIQKMTYQAERKFERWGELSSSRLSYKDQSWEWPRDHSEWL